METDTLVNIILSILSLDMSVITEVTVVSK